MTDSKNSNDTAEKNDEFTQKFLKKIKCIENDKDWAEKDYLNRNRFIMKSSTDISINLIKEANKLINRDEALEKINSFVKDNYISYNIEKGLFEAALLHVTLKKLDVLTVLNVYLYKLHSICVNLDENNNDIKNKTLLNAIHDGKLKPYMIAFLSPQQMHPERWESVKQKQMREDDAMYNIETTDEYECPKCKERKCTVTYIQLRSADEPESKFIVCVVCGTTVIQ